jgi:DTW domain-containing protein
MAHHSLPNSEMHVTLTAVGNKDLESLAQRTDVALLFPADDASDVATLTVPPRTLVVVDGTWSNAKKVVMNCPILSTLPRLKFFPETPGNYRIRKEPEAHCLATIEAIAFVLEKLEKSPGKFVPMLSVFEAMVEKQLEYIRSNGGTTRHKFTRKRNTVRVDPFEDLQRDFKKLVLVFGESNAWPLDDLNRPQPHRPELVQLMGLRVSTGEHFSSLLKPEQPLGPRVHRHLDVERAVIETAPERERVLGDWSRFLKPDDVLVGWGRYCNDLLQSEETGPQTFVNFRSRVASKLEGAPGSVETLGLQLGATLPEGQGRAPRRMAALAHVLNHYCKGAS